MGCILHVCLGESDSTCDDDGKLDTGFDSAVSNFACDEFENGDTPLLTMWTFRSWSNAAAEECSLENEDNIYIPNLDECALPSGTIEMSNCDGENGTSVDHDARERPDIIDACINVMDACNSSTDQCGTSGGRRASYAAFGGHNDKRKTRTKATKWWTVLRTSIQVATVWEQLLKNRRNNWVQLAGHQGNIAPASLSTVWKKMPGPMSNEVTVYEQLMKDEMSQHVPKFHRNVLFNNEYFLEMEDLLCHFKDPAVMDIKLGTRTFLESEVTSVKLRKDLYEKMFKLDPTEPTEEELKCQAITKLRYMQFREKNSSSSSLGFRIEALRIHGESAQPALKCLRTRESISNILSKFCGSMRDSILNKLEIFRNTFISSKFFRNHEIIGSSLLLLYDIEHTQSGVWMIDFGKTYCLPGGRQTDHRQDWALGNHEDGFLTGLDNLIEIVQAIKCEDEASGNG